MTAILTVLRTVCGHYVMSRCIAQSAMPLPVMNLSKSYEEQDQEREQE